MISLHLVGDAVSTLLAQGKIFEALSTYYMIHIGLLFPALLAITVSLYFYIRTQDMSYVVATWIMIGGAVVQYIPGVLLDVGRVLITIGIAIVVVRVFLGRESK